MPQPKSSQKNTIVSVTPSESSLTAQIVAHIVKMSRAKNCTVENIDLFDGSINCTLSRDDMANYGGGVVYQDLLNIHNLLIGSSRLFFVFPVWMYGAPACLKGLCERIFRPNITFNTTTEGISPMIKGVSDVYVFCSSGQQEQDQTALADPVRTTFEMLVRQNFDFHTDFHYRRLWGTDSLAVDDLKNYLAGIDEIFFTELR